jgi:hypothetical protein
MTHPIGQSPAAIHARITRELSMLTVTTGYVIKQRYADDSWHVVGRKKTILRARVFRDGLKAHYGNVFKIVRMYRKVRYSHE